MLLIEACAFFIQNLHNHFNFLCHNLYDHHHHHKPSLLVAHRAEKTSCTIKSIIFSLFNVQLITSQNQLFR